MLLAATTGNSPLAGYLATAPGGLYAVLGVALGSNDGSAFISSMQVLRILVMMAFAPLLGAWMRGRAGGSS